MLCIFCSLVDAPAFANPEDEILDENEYFYAKAALGHFVSGYMLIVSKEHLISYSILPPDLFPLLDQFTTTVVKKINRITGEGVMIFEHGSISRPQRAGSCIDHAHLHLFPTGNIMVPTLLKQFSFGQIQLHQEITRFHVGEVPYLYLEEPNGRKYVAHAPENLPNQLIRRVATDALGCPNLWDWREHLFRDRLELFKKRYKETH